MQVHTAESVRPTVSAPIDLIEPTDVRAPQALVAQGQQAVQPVPATPGASLLQLAVQRGASIEELRELMALEREWRADQAKQAYAEDFALFKAEAVEILKRKRVFFESKRTETTTDYKHAELSDVVEAVAPALSKHGFSWGWKVKSQARDWIVVECTLRHRLGHSEAVEMGGPPDNSGNKNPLQQIASTKTYLERYTLKAICGVAEKGDDDDGQGGPEQPSADPVLVAFTTAAMKGEAALRKHYDANVPTEDFWREKGPYLRKLAKDVDAKAAVQP